MRSRMVDELGLLRERFPGAIHQEHNSSEWFLLPDYRCPDGWAHLGEPVETLSIAFMVNASYPGQPPYAFLAPRGLTFNGTAPNNYVDVPDGHCPFHGSWAQFSWSPRFTWEPAAEVTSGVNLLHWARSFGERLKEGL